MKLWMVAAIASLGTTLAGASASASSCYSCEQICYFDCPYGDPSCCWEDCVEIACEEDDVPVESRQEETGNGHDDLDRSWDRMHRDEAPRSSR